MNRRRPTEGTATLLESLDITTAPQGSQLSSLIERYNSSIDPVERISLFRQLGVESEKSEYSEQIDAQSPDETLPPAAEEQVGSQAPDESLPPGVDDQINAQGPLHLMTRSMRKSSLFRKRKLSWITLNRGAS
eukprot:6213966-Pleurochrysis_carterae.AAC.1